MRTAGGALGIDLLRLEPFGGYWRAGVGGWRGGGDDAGRSIPRQRSRVWRHIRPQHEPESNRRPLLTSGTSMNWLAEPTFSDAASRSATRNWYTPAFFTGWLTV